MEHVESDEDFIIVRGSANRRSLDVARIKRKNIFYVLPEYAPCFSRIFHSSSCSETYNIGDLLEVHLQDGKVCVGKFQDGIILGDVYFTCDEGITGKYVTQVPMETFSNPITEEELVKIHIKNNNRESAATTKQSIKRDCEALFGDPSNRKKPWRSRLEDIKKLITGRVIELHLQNRCVYSGRLQDGIILEEASLIDQEETPAIGTVAFPASAIVLVKNKEHNSDSDEYFSAEEGSYDFDVQMEIVPPPIYSYGTDRFQLYGFPHPKLGEAIGLVGQKHTGKTTVLNILAGKLMLNLCKPEEPPQWQAIMDHLDFIKDQPGAKEFRSYLARLRANDLKVSMKTQVVSQGDVMEMQQCQPFSETVRDILAHHCRNPYRVMEMCDMVGIGDEILTSLPRQLTNAEVQKVKIAAALLKEADVYLLDEPSRYLTRKQRLGVAHAIVSVIGPNRYVFVADEDIKMVEHISKYVFKLDGTPNQVGHVKPFPYRRP